MKEHFRNLKNLTTPEGEYVESGSLWIKNDSEMFVLVDEDRYVTYNDKSAFAKA